MTPTHRPVTRRPGLIVVLAVALVVAVAGVAAAVAALRPDTPTSDADPPPPGASAGTFAQGVVRSADGAPVPGASVLVEPMPGSPAVPEIAVTTGADGSYSWPLAPGTYRLLATTASERAAPVVVTVTTGSVRADLVLGG